MLFVSTMVCMAQTSRIIRSSLLRVASSSRRFSSTYYDSQSGQHVPVHQEDKISIILNTTKNDHHGSFIPHPLYKDGNGSSNFLEWLRSFTEESSIHGLILPDIPFSRDERNQITLGHIMIVPPPPPPGFTLFSYHIPPSDSSLYDKKIVVLLDYDYEVTSVEENRLSNALKDLSDRGLKTTIVLNEDKLYYHGGEHQEPIMVANAIATQLDTTGGGDYLWIAGHRNTSDKSVATDDILALCEELMYLDVRGATVKSRLMIDALDTEVVEETMLLGVNKFVVETEEEIKTVRRIANDQGKHAIVLE